MIILYFIPKYRQQDNNNKQKMNMVNYLRGKIAKVQVDSPSKKVKNITIAQQIYIDQVNNYIELGGGYDVLKQKLFEDINQNHMPQSPLVQEIVILIRKGLETKQKQKQKRCITLIEDLVSNCGRVINQVFNDHQFCELLANNAVYLRNLKSQLRDELRQRACGIFLFWHQKYNTQPHYVFHKYYEKLKVNNAQFPRIPYITQKKYYKTQPNDHNQSNDGDVDFIISDCERVASETDHYLKNDPTQIDTNYVRLLKAKNKKMYTISTSGGNLTETQKERMGKVYKKLRTQLKQIDKINETNIKEKVIAKEKQFLQQKILGISPKRSEKQIPKIVKQNSPNRVASNHGSSGKKVSNQKNEINIFGEPILPNPIFSPQRSNSEKETLNILDLNLSQGNDNQKQLTTQKVTQLKKTTSQRKEQPREKDLDIFNFQPIHQQANKINSIQYTENVHYFDTTPKKVEKLLDFDADDYQSPASQKRLNFKQLYSSNQLSPQLKNLDLLGSAEKIKKTSSLQSQDRLQNPNRNRSNEKSQNKQEKYACEIPKQKQDKKKQKNKKEILKNKQSISSSEDDGSFTQYA